MLTRQLSPISAARQALEHMIDYAAESHGIAAMSVPKWYVPNQHSTTDGGSQSLHSWKAASGLFSDVLHSTRPCYLQWGN
jgi:hypothetical protein